MVPDPGPDGDVRMKICCYAFATTALFFQRLVALCRQAGDPVEWSVIFPQAPFRHALDDLVPSESRLYLYRDFQRIYRAQRPPYDWRNGAGIDSIYLALAKDKDGYRHLDKDEQLRRAATITAIYGAFLRRTAPDAVLFPDVETVDGFILVNLCQERGIPIIYHADLRHIGRSMFGSDIYNTLPPYFGTYTAEDLAEAKTVIAEFAAGTVRTARDKHPPSAPPKPSLLRRAVLNTWLRWRYERLHATEVTLAMRVRMNFLPFVTTHRRRRFERTSPHFFDLSPSSPALPPRYILFFLHVTPRILDQRRCAVLHRPVPLDRSAAPCHARRLRAGGEGASRHRRPAASAATMQPCGGGPEWCWPIPIYRAATSCAMRRSSSPSPARSGSNATCSTGRACCSARSSSAICARAWARCRICRRSFAT